MAILSRIHLGRIGYIIRFCGGLGNVEPGDFGVYCHGAQKTDRLVRSIVLAIAGVAGLACGAVAQAQTAPSDDVTVNPYAVGPRPYSRYAAPRPLLQPGETDPNAPIQLHMPVLKQPVRRSAKPATAREAATAKPRTQRAAQGPAQAGAMQFSDLPSESASTLVAPESIAPARVVQKPPPPSKKVAVAAKP